MLTLRHQAREMRLQSLVAAAQICQQRGSLPGWGVKHGVDQWLQSWPMVPRAPAALPVV